jgi:hypothetical protein
MTSVDTDPALAKREREAFFELLDPGTWQIYGGHGAMFLELLQREICKLGC